MSDSNIGWESLTPFLYADSWSVIDAYVDIRRICTAS